MKYQTILKSDIPKILSRKTNEYEFLKPLLLILFLIILSIIIYNHRNNGILELFSNDNKLYPSLSPANDTHFIKDNSEAYIDTPILNYKLEALTADHQPMSVYLTIFQHKKMFNSTPLGQYCHISIDPMDIAASKKNFKDKESIKTLSTSKIFPKDYQFVWTSSRNENGESITVWRPIPPPNSFCMSDIITLNTKGVNPYTKPALDLICCIPSNMREKSNVSNGLIWSAINEKNEACFCWNATNMDYFRCSLVYGDKMNDLEYVYNIKPIAKNENTVLNNDLDKITV